MASSDGVFSTKQMDCIKFFSYIFFTFICEVNHREFLDCRQWSLPLDGIFFLFVNQNLIRQKQVALVLISIWKSKIIHSRSRLVSVQIRFLHWCCHSSRQALSFSFIFHKI